MKLLSTSTFPANTGVFFLKKIMLFSPESQGVLADYNLLVDKLNTDTDRAEVEEEAREMRAQNDTEAKEVTSTYLLFPKDNVGK